MEARRRELIRYTVGPILGGLVGIILIVGAIVYLCRKRKVADSGKLEQPAEKPKVTADGPIAHHERSAT